MKSNSRDAMTEHPSARQKAAVQDRLRAAMALIKAEIDASYDPRTGRYAYAVNRGRLSLSEVLRRAGGIDKNTLRQPYHADLRREAEAFVRMQAGRLQKGQDRRNSDDRLRHREGKAEVVRLAQIAYAAELRAVTAEANAEQFRQQLAEMQRRVDSQEKLLAKAGVKADVFTLRPV